MEPRIETLNEKKLIGKYLKMSLSNDRTAELWRSFMPEKRHIKNNIGNDLFCLQIYDESLEFKDFNPDTEYEKWAAIEVSDFNGIPEEMSEYTLKGGLYAVFTYKGKASNFAPTFRYIYYQWLPNSEYELDKRTHFDLLGSKYKNNEDDSEEEIWVPIKLKLD